MLITGLDKVNLHQLNQYAAEVTGGPEKTDKSSYSIDINDLNTKDNKLGVVGGDSRRSGDAAQTRSTTRSMI